MKYSSIQSRIYWYMYRVSLIIILSPLLVFANSVNTPLSSNVKFHSLSTTTIHKILSMDTAKTPVAQKKSAKALINLFEKQNYSIFFKEAQLFLHKNPTLPYKKELQWLIAHALLEDNQLAESEKILISLLTDSNIEIKSRVLIDLAQINYLKKKYKSVQKYLIQLVNMPSNSIFKEVAYAKLIHTLFIQNNLCKVLKYFDVFKELFPLSPYLHELQYLIVINELSLNHIDTAEKYAKDMLKKSANPDIQRILAEIGLQKKNYQQTLEYYIPLSIYTNKYQDEALYKIALIYKMNGDFTNAHKHLSKIQKYFKESSFHRRATEELANVNILLRKYDEALIFFLAESGYTGKRKAGALLKIMEINFLKGNFSSLYRTANRIQKEFPYSSYANEAIYWVGRSFMMDKKFLKAIAIFEDYLLREPQNEKKYEILIFLGNAHLRLNQMTNARVFFEKILSSCSDETLKRHALIGIGKSYNELEPVRSLDFFDTVWKTWPFSRESDQALYFSGATRYNLKKNQESLKNFLQLIEEFPNSLLYENALLAIAKLRFKLEEFPEIKKILDNKFIKNKELQSELKEILARSLHRSEKYAESLTVIEEAMVLSSENYRKKDLFLLETSSLRHLGRYEEAIGKYEKYLQKTKNVSEDHELILSELALSYLENNNPSKASHIVTNIELYFPKSPYITDIYFKIAEHYTAKKMPVKSTEFYRKIKQQTEDIELKKLANLGEISSLYEYKKSSVKPIIERFLNDFPSHDSTANLMEKLSVLYAEEGNRNEADRIRKNILQTYPKSLEAEKIRENLVAKFTDKNSKFDYLAQINKTSDPKLKAKFLFQLAHKLEKSGEFTESIKTYKRVEIFDDELGIEAAFSAAKILSKMKKPEESLATYIDIIKKYDRKYYPRALEQIIEIYKILKEPEKAEKFKKRLLQDFPDSQSAKKLML